MAEPIWTPDLRHRTGARYRAIADALADDIGSGRLAPGRRLPTHRALADALGVTVGTITRAYAEAERRGLVDATVGKGTYVRGAGGRVDANLSSAADAICFPALSPPAGRASPQHAGGFAQTALPARDDGLIDLSANYPVATYLPDALDPAVRALADPARLNLAAGYQPAVGRPEHREAGAAWLGRLGLRADPRDVVISNGCQGGLSIALDTLAHPGETVLVEALAWPGIHALTQQRGVRVAPVAMDSEGIEPEALRAAALRYQARVALCMPTLQNPTNRVMSEARRRALLNVAAELGLMLVEDDIYGFLSPVARAPLASLAPDHAVYVTSMSKCVAPGLRIGYVKAPRGLVHRLGGAQRAASVMACAMTAEMARHLIETGHADTAANRQREAAESRQRLAAARLPAAHVLADPTSFHLWLTLPPAWSSAAFVRAAWSRGVAVTPGDAFTPDGGDPRGVRICLCAEPDLDRLSLGLDTLAELLAEAPMSTAPMV
jgi:DNA-binding transcriptional MocR family regulator